MELETAVQQYLIRLKETAPRERVEFELTILARLQEYLEGDPALDRAEAIRAADIRAFIVDWLRTGDEITREAAEGLVAAVVGFAGWLDDQLASPGAHSSLGSQWSACAGDRPHRAPLAPALAPLEESLPRTARAAVALRRHARRDDLSQEIPVGEVAGGSPLGTISGGVDRVVRPGEIDYGRAEEDTFLVVEVDERSVSLTSQTREQLGEGPAAPVAVPARAARLLRVGDILHVEIAPSATGWEILNVESVVPGGLDERP